METILLSFILLISVSGISADNTTDSRYRLTIVGLLPITGDWPGGIAVLETTKLALEHVNSRQDILPDYKLEFVYDNTVVRTFSGQTLYFLNMVCFCYTCKLYHHYTKTAYYDKTVLYYMHIDLQGLS